MAKNMVFAIPSLGRSDVIEHQALKTLADLKVPKSKINIFVANEEEREAYDTALRGEYEIVVGIKGLGLQRQFINSYYPAETRIVSIDDDILLMAKNENRLKVLEGDLVKISKKAFDLCDKTGCRMWGVPDTLNGFFMKDRVVKGVRGCAGAFFGEYSQESDCQSLLPHCDDLEKMILHCLKYGAVLRLDNIGLKQTRYSKGGCNEDLGGLEGRIAVYWETFNYCLEKYPEFVALKKNPDPIKGLSRIKTKTYEVFPSLLG